MNEIKELKKVDDVVILKFLTSFAKILTEHGLFKAVDADNFKIQTDLLDFNNANSILYQLITQQADILYLCITRYGEIGFSINLFKYGLKEYLQNHTIKICENIPSFTHFAKLFFNRLTPYKIENKEIKKIFLPHIFLDIAESFKYAVNVLKELHKECTIMNASDFTINTKENFDFDYQIAKLCGFTDIAYYPLNISSINILKEKIIFPYKIIHVALKNFSVIFNSTILEDKFISIKTTCDEIKIELLKLENSNIPQSLNLLIWQDFRVNIFNALEKLNTLIIKAIEQICSIFTTDFHLFETYSIHIASSSSIRQLTTFLVQEGINIHKASKAAHNLLEYCKKNDIFPSKILEEELPRIDSSLSINALNLFKTIEPDKEIYFKDILKDKVLHNINELESFFKLTLNFFKALCIILSINLIFNSCGLKLAPKSDVLDPMPQIEYKIPKNTNEYTTEEQYNNNNNNNNKSTNQKPTQNKIKKGKDNDKTH